jgi:hypothetical protein
MSDSGFVAQYCTVVQQRQHDGFCATAKYTSSARCKSHLYILGGCIETHFARRDGH